MSLRQHPGVAVNRYHLRMQGILRRCPDGGANVLDAFLMAAFVNGLRAKFQDWVVPRQPEALDEAVALALSWEHAEGVWEARRRWLAVAAGSAAQTGTRRRGAKEHEGAVYEEQQQREGRRHSRGQGQGGGQLRPAPAPAPKPCAPERESPCHRRRRRPYERRTAGVNPAASAALVPYRRLLGLVHPIQTLPSRSVQSEVSSQGFSIRLYYWEESKREVEENVDVRSSWEEYEERENVDSIKYAGRFRKHGYEDEVEQQDEDRTIISSSNGNESRRNSAISSSRVCSADEDVYHVRDSRSPKIPRRSPDDSKDRDSDRRRGRENKNDWDSSRRYVSETSAYGISQSRSRSKVDGPYDGECERLKEKGARSTERRESSKEKLGEWDQEGKMSLRRVDDIYTNESGDSSRADARDEKYSSEHNKHRSAREMVHDYKNESGESRSKGVDSSSSRGGGGSGSKEDSSERRGSAMVENVAKDSRSADQSHETGLHALTDDKHGKAPERIANLHNEVGESDLRMYSTKSDEKEEILAHKAEYTYESNGGMENKEISPNLDKDGWELSGAGSNRETIHAQQSQIPEKLGRYQSENNEYGQGHPDLDNERSIGTKDKTRVDAHRDDKSDRGRDINWNEKTRELEGSKDYLRNHQWRDSKEANDSEWRNAQERLDGGSFHGRAGHRRDSRGRSESIRGSSTYGNRYDSSDSIEIRPNSNLDFGREGSVSGRRFDVGAHRDLIPGANDDKCAGHPEADQSGSTSMISPFPQQGPKGDRPSRGGRGRPNGRDSQRIGVPVPLMPPPPFGPLGLPPGPMQHMGPNIPHSPGHPLLPGVFMPQFPGPLVWPGARGVDVNMLSVPPNLPIPPPVAAEHRFTPSMGAGPGHNIHLNQIGTGIGAPTNVSGLGFNQMGTQSREMPHDKPSAGWAPHRNSGLTRKAPSRGEQNDYSQNFVDTGMRPQNFIRELDLTSVAEDYPKLRELIQRKDNIVAKSASPPMYYKCDLREHVLSPEFFGTKFDVILVDPPWEEYVHRAPGITDHIEYWNAEEIMNLKIEAIADTPSFVFLWVGDGVGLEQGRQCLKKWGFRRCEDVCWVKTNKKNATSGLRHDSHTLLQHSKEHCLMGIKGTVRRSTDGHVIHANIDTDIIIAEEPTDGSTKKPEDMYRIIEHFALGRRRLELFGEDHNIRPGWLTLGKGLSYSNFNKEAYINSFADKDGKVWQGGGGRNPPPEAPHLVVTTPEIEGLRPKSPPQKN